MFSICFLVNKVRKFGAAMIIQVFQIFIHDFAKDLGFSRSCCKEITL